MIPLAVILLAGAGLAPGDVGEAKPLPGNKPCAYPPEAQKQYVAGSVRFRATVRPDGTVEGVDVLAVPLPYLDFAQSVRACVTEWRFGPAPAGWTGPRTYEGHLRFRLQAAEEAALRVVFEALAAAWNAADMKAVEDLALRHEDVSSVHYEPGPALGKQLEGDLPEPRWRMELAPEIEHVRFIGAGVVNVTQLYRKVYVGDQGREATDSVIYGHAAKGARGWRFVSLSSGEVAWRDAIRVGRSGPQGSVPEPRKVKDTRPQYPDAVKSARVQGVVIMDCLITPEGKVTRVRLLKGAHPLLDAAAMEAVRHWEYTPTLLNGVAVPVILTVTINFRLS